LTALPGNRSVSLGWTASPGTVTYAVYQYTGTSAPADPREWALIASGIPSTQYTVTGLRNGTSYAFAVTAVNVEGSSDFSNVVIAVPYDGIPPEWPEYAALRVRILNYSDVELSWPEAADNEAVTQYQMYVNGAHHQTVTGDVHQWVITGLQRGFQYTMAVIALDDYGNESAPLTAPSFLLWPEDDDDSGVPAGGGTNPPSRGDVELIEEPEKEPEDELQDAEHQQDAADEPPSAGEADEAGEPVPERREPARNFTDIQGHWAAQSIQDAVGKGLVLGYPDGTFKPDKPITRAELALLLAKALQLQGEESEAPVADQKAIGGWAKKAIAQLIKAGIFSGYADGYFRPNQPITRAEFAVVIARVLGLDTSSNAGTGFADDAKIPAWAKAAIEALRLKGLMDGQQNSMFVPGGNVTRAEAVNMLIKLLEMLQNRK
jgi:chondroitin AC lyase